MCVAKTIIHQEKKIFISTDVMNLFETYKQKKKTDTEACGILMCSIDKNTNNVYISHATEPQLEDIRKRKYFFLKDKKHQTEVNRIYKESKGTIFLCGTWHTHPEDIPKASMLDTQDWKKFINGNIEQIQNFYFIISGKKDIRLYTVENNTIKLVKG